MAKRLFAQQTACRDTLTATSQNIMANAFANRPVEYKAVSRFKHLLRRCYVTKTKQERYFSARTSVVSYSVCYKERKSFGHR